MGLLLTAVEKTPTHGHFSFYRFGWLFKYLHIEDPYWKKKQQQQQQQLWKPRALPLSISEAICVYFYVLINAFHALRRGGRSLDIYLYIYISIGIPWQSWGHKIKYIGRTKIA